MYRATWKNKKKKQLKPQYNYSTSLFKLQKENKLIKGKIIKGIKNFFRLEKEKKGIKDFKDF